jgi:hypothetical protein
MSTTHQSRCARVTITLPATLKEAIDNVFTPPKTGCAAGELCEHTHKKTRGGLPTALCGPTCFCCGGKTHDEETCCTSIDDMKDGPLNHILNWEYISAEALELFAATFSALKKKDPRPDGKYNCGEVWEILGEKCICHLCFEKYRLLLMKFPSGHGEDSDDSSSGDISSSGEERGDESVVGKTAGDDGQVKHNLNEDEAPPSAPPLSGGDDDPAAKAPASAAVKLAAFHESNDFRALAKYTLEELDVREWISFKRRQEYGSAWPYTLVAATVGVVENSK